MKSRGCVSHPESLAYTGALQNLRSGDRVPLQRGKELRLAL